MSYTEDFSTVVVPQRDGEHALKRFEPSLRFGFGEVAFFEEPLDLVDVVLDDDPRALGAFLALGREPVLAGRLRRQSSPSWPC